MSARLLNAHLSLRCCGTGTPVRNPRPRWVLFVALEGEVSRWPTHAWPASRAIPVPQQRTEALTGLGYAPLPDEEWQWVEGSSMCPRHPGVRLIAVLRVRPLPAGTGTPAAGLPHGEVSA